MVQNAVIWQVLFVCIGWCEGTAGAAEWRQCQTEDTPAWTSTRGSYHMLPLPVYLRWSDSCLWLPLKLLHVIQCCLTTSVGWWP